MANDLGLDSLLMEYTAALNLPVMALKTEQKTLAALC
ncbi:MAG: hypothetical protein ACI9RO_002192 [Alteromonas macleodii]|jgi:hypothetical protein